MWTTSYFRENATAQCAEVPPANGLMRTRIRDIGCGASVLHRDVQLLRSADIAERECQWNRIAGRYCRDNHGELGRVPCCREPARN